MERTGSLSPALERVIQGAVCVYFGTIFGAIVVLWPHDRPLRHLPPAEPTVSYCENPDAEVDAHAFPKFAPCEQFWDSFDT